MLNSNFIKNAAYCAIFMLVTGCAAGNSSISNAAINDVLTADKVRARANALPNLAAAQAIEKDAMARQAAADASVVNIETRCMPKFLVTRCIDAARNARNDAWDAAQIDLTSARLYIRTFESNQKKAELEQKLAKFTAEQKANIPIRAANKAAYIAKQAAYKQRQIDYAKQQASDAPQRAANVVDFKAKRAEILALQKKRADEAAKRVADAAAKK